MKISDLKDSLDHSVSAFVREYGYRELYIGVSSSSQRGYHEFDSSSRLPRDTFVVLHNLANHLSMKRFGVPIRQGIFTTRESENAAAYGDNVMRFVPNDGYEMYYNPSVDDFTLHSELGTQYRKLERTIAAHINSIVGKALMDFSYHGGRAYLNFLKTVDVDYETFNILEVSRYYFDKEYFTSRELDTVTIERFYTKLGEIWNNYYKDVASYVDGLRKVDDIKAVPKGVEVIAFPYNGFWLI